MSHKENCDCEHEACECGDECKCGEACDCGCGCNGCRCGGFKRRYQTKAEQVNELKSYLAELRLEVQAVEERLADLEK
jgi:Eukaryotic metallothionein